MRDIGFELFLGTTKKRQEHQTQVDARRSGLFGTGLRTMQEGRSRGCETVVHTGTQKLVDEQSTAGALSFQLIVMSKAVIPYPYQYYFSGCDVSFYFPNFVIYGREMNHDSLERETLNEPWGVAESLSFHSIGLIP